MIESAPGGERARILRSSLPIYETFVRSTLHPQAEREATWQQIAAEISEGPFWLERYGGAAPPSRLEDFPITEFAEYRPTLDAAIDSRLSPLTGKPIIWWSHSTGTTSANRKLL